MSVNRPFRGVPLPSIWQVLVVTMLGGAAFLVWREFSGKTESPPTETPANAVTNMQAVEELAERGSEGVPELIALLASDDRSLRRLALYGLGRMGSEALSALEPVREQLDDEDPFVRAAALAAFADMCPEPDVVLATYVRMLADSDPGNREKVATVLENSRRLPRGNSPDRNSSAARMIDRIDVREIVHSVAAMAHAERPETRLLVIQIATHRDTKNDEPEVTQMLHELLADSDGTVRAAAIRAYASRGAARIEQVREWLRDADSRIVDAALAGVSWLGDDSVAALPDLLNLVDKVADDRLHKVIETLPSLGLDAKPAIAGLVRRLAALEIHSYEGQGIAFRKGGRNFDMERVRKFDAAPALLAIGAETAEVATALGGLLDPADRSFDSESAQWLARLSPDEARRHGERMVRDIESNRTMASREALVLLGALGPAASDAVPLLIRLIETRNEQPRGIEWYSVEALGAIGADAAAAVPCLREILLRPRTDHLAADQHGHAARSLGKIGPAARSAVPALIKILEMPEPPPSPPSLEAIRRPPPGYRPEYAEIMTALGQIGDNSEAVLAALRNQLQNRDQRSRLAALKALVALCPNPDGVVADQILCLEDPSPDVRLIAADMRDLQGERQPAVAALTKALRDEDPWVASAAALSLREFGSDAISAAPVLREIIGDIRNQAPNGVRVRRQDARDLRLDSDVRRMSRLKLSDAAQQALDAIEPNL